MADVSVELIFSFSKFKFETSRGEVPNRSHWFKNFHSFVRGKKIYCCGPIMVCLLWTRWLVVVVLSWLLLEVYNASNSFISSLWLSLYNQELGTQLMDSHKATIRFTAPSCMNMIVLVKYFYYLSS